MLDEILVLERRAVVSTSTPPLLLVARDRRPLDVPRVGDGHDHVLLGDQVLDRELALVARDLRAPLVAELLRYILQLFLHQGDTLRTRLEQLAKSLDQRADLLQLLLQLFDLEPGQLCEAHVEDRLSLPLRELEPLLQLSACRWRVGRLANDLDHLVDVVDGDLEPLEDVLAIERLVEPELRAADDD